MLALLLVAWIPFGAEALVHKIRSLNYYPDEEVAFMFGFWLYVWWPCHIAVALMLLYKGIRWFVRPSQNSN